LTAYFVKKKICFCIAKTLLHAFDCTENNAELGEKLEIAECMEKYIGTVLIEGQERQKKKKVLDYCREAKSTENRRKEGMN